MTHDDLLAAFRSRNALLIHCSVEAKGRDPNDRVYPDDLRNAIQVFDKGPGTLCCSVVWPEQLYSFGTLGIVLKPRTLASVTGVVTGDGGTEYDKTTGLRTKGRTVPLTAQNLASTFTPGEEHNEWTVGDADCVGIYFAPPGPYVQVAQRVGAPGPDGKCGTVLLNLTMDDVRSDFPGLPVFTFIGRDILRWGPGPY